MRHLSCLAIAAALVGGAVMFTTHSVAAAPNAGASLLGLQAADQADSLYTQVQAKQRASTANRGGRVASGGNRGGRVASGGNRGGRVANTGRGQRQGRGGGGGGGGGGFGGAMEIFGIATDVMSGIAEAEEARAAEAQDDAIAQCQRRYRSYDPQTQTYVGRGKRVYKCP
jgi:hypothetical protein